MQKLLRSLTMTRIYVIAVLLLIVAIAGINCSDPKSKAGVESLKIPVEVAQVKKGTVTKELSYTGDVLAEQEVKVFSKIPDRILNFYKDEGDYVGKGQVIAKIEATRIEQAVVQSEAAVVSAKAQLANLEAEYQRAQRLYQENAMSKQQYDAVATQTEATRALVGQSEAVLAQAKSQLADAAITAPISGIIGVRYFEPGDMAAGPLPLLTIVQMNRVKIELNAPEQDMGELKVGQCSQIKVTSYPDEVFTGVINQISPVLDPITRMSKIEILVDNKDKRLKPGMFAEVTICVRTLQDVIVIPKLAVLQNTALQRVNGEDVAVIKSQVFVEQNNVAFLRDVNLGYINGTVAVIVDGLDISERIVVIGQQALKDSAEVKVMNEQN